MKLQKLVASLAKGLERTEPRCKHFGRCGGCSLQHLTYESQLELKIELVKHAFNQVGLEAELSPIEAVEKWFYRNRMDYVVAPGPKVGLRKAGRWYKVVDLEECFLLSKGSTKVLNDFREFLKQEELAPYDLRSREGLVRYLVLREGKNTGRRLAIVLTKDRGFPFETYAKRAQALGCTAVALALNPGPSDTSSGEVINYLGEPLTERVGGYEFSIRPYSFFQTNTRMAQTLVEVVKEWAGDGEILLDLYCGIGLFGIVLHHEFSKVIGIESDPLAALDARANAKANGCENLVVLEGAVEKELPGLEGDVAVVDPPRAGMHPRALSALISSGATTVIYVSCSPASMARDLGKLKHAFKLEGPILLLDMFPWTSHVELVAKLERR